LRMMIDVPDDEAAEFGLPGVKPATGAKAR